jgi:hypothetical protein
MTPFDLDQPLVLIWVRERSDENPPTATLRVETCRLTRAEPTSAAA